MYFCKRLQSSRLGSRLGFQLCFQLIQALLHRFFFCQASYRDVSYDRVGMFEGIEHFADTGIMLQVFGKVSCISSLRWNLFQQLSIPLVTTSHQFTLGRQSPPITGIIHQGDKFVGGLSVKAWHGAIFHYLWFHADNVSHLCASPLECCTFPTCAVQTAVAIHICICWARHSYEWFG